MPKKGARVISRKCAKGFNTKKILSLSRSFGIHVIGVMKKDIWTIDWSIGATSRYLAPTIAIIMLAKYKFSKWNRVRIQYK